MPGATKRVEFIMAFYSVPINLPHAATLVNRIELRLASLQVLERAEAEQILMLIEQLQEKLGRYEGANDPPDDEMRLVVEESAPIAREIVNEIEQLQVGEDRLGQLIRNLFECMGLGKEGAEISLRAGENPNSLLRPLDDQSESGT
jgi:hypothetical protein